MINIYQAVAVDVPALPKLGPYPGDESTIGQIRKDILAFLKATNEPGVIVHTLFYCFGLNVILFNIQKQLDLQAEDVYLPEELEDLWEVKEAEAFAKKELGRSQVCF